ncbi:MAG: DUF6273 domain-containing protein, partial [Bacteroidales bacterium]|nr:DUF6273 domain-containing protein [Bacteroidales bacterium]
MAETYNIPRDQTLKDLITVEEQRNAYLAVLSAASMSDVFSDYAAIQRIVRSGQAANIFQIGDQINVKWTDLSSNTEYEIPFDVVHFGEVELEDGETVPGMYLQAHYTIPNSIVFDGREAFYYAEDGLSAGTYWFTFGYTWGNMVNGESFEFTLEDDVPAGGQLYFNSDLYSGAQPGGSTIRVYSDGASTTALQSATLTQVESSDGTFLGTMTRAFEGNLGSLYTAARGYNRWAVSAYRQWLNSDKGVGEWWTQQSGFDRVSTDVATYPGFLTGFEEDFLNVIQPVKVTTALNTVDGMDLGTLEDTYDRFFLPALNQQNISPQLAGEGDIWEYWQKATGSSSTISRDNVAGTYPLFYDISDKVTARAVWLRSASRSTATSVWYVTSTGAVTNSTAYNGFRCAPAC